MNIIQLPFDAKPEVGLSFLPQYPNAKVQTEFDLSLEEHKLRDIEWRHALAYNKIQVK